MSNWEQIVKYAKNGNLKPPHRVEKTDAEWKEILDPETYRITRDHGTEMPGSGQYCEAFDPGLYACKCCKTILFDSQTKFDSGTGWPSFNQPIEENLIYYKIDNSLSRERVETLCNVCDAHLGHVFPDGPPPTGLRYCINSVALTKIK